MKNIKFVSIILAVYIFFAFILINKNNQIENFDPSEYKDAFSEFYAMLFDKVFSEDDMYKAEVNMISKFIEKNRVNPALEKDNIKILDAGSGPGRHLQYISQKYKTIGCDRSRNMIRRSKLRNPLAEVKEKDLKDVEAFNEGEFSHILCLKDTLYHNEKKDWNEILSNFYYWLQPGGYLIIHVFDPEKLDPAPRNFSQYTKDENKRKHAVTHFKKFSHDAWWTKSNSNKDKHYFHELVLGKNGDKKIFKNRLYIPRKEEVLDEINRNIFKLESIDHLEDLEIYDHEIYYFRKPLKMKENVIKNKNAD